MPRDPEPTRNRILDAALELFAANGIAATSLREIRLAAGQRNTAALQYHFGDTRGLLVALLERELPVLIARREALLADAHDLHSTATAVVLPFAEFATGTDHERTRVRFLSQLHDEPELTRDELVELIGDTRGAEAYAMVRAFVAAPMRRRLPTRYSIAMGAFLHAAALRAACEPATARTSDAQFRRELVDMFLGSLLASY